MRDLNDAEFSKLKDEYKSQIILPTKSQTKQFYLCPVGLVGSGKSTVLKSITENVPLVRISGDELRKFFNERGYNHERLWDLAGELVKEFTKKGYSIAMDTDCATVRTREFLDKLSKEYNVKIIFIHINPPEDFIINKLKNYKHTWLFKNADEALENYYNRKPLHTNLQLPYVYEFDTSKPNLRNQINECVAIILELVKV